MSNIATNINNILSQAGVSLSDRPAATALLVAETVGNLLTIPSSPVQDPRTHYLTTHRQVVNDQLSAINEECVIDIDEVESVAFKLWLTRYRLVHQPESMTAQKLMQALLENGAQDIPKRYTEISCKYRNLYADGALLATTTRKPSGV